ncbi:MAG: CYTH domain-containing protein [Cyanobacteria bacterium P01_D01_bin.36]
MPQEIERKFLVANDSWRANATGELYCQGYIATTAPGHSVRVRIAGDRAYLTIKGPTQGLSRAEFEYEIPVVDAQEMLHTLCDRPLIEKMRYRLPIGPIVWEIDEFKGENAGLIIAEVELDTEEQSFERPGWLGQEVSGETQYYNASLVNNPYSKWSQNIGKAVG